VTPDLLVTAFVTLFVVIDPIGLAPLFVALTQGADATERRRIALRATAVAFGLLAVFGLAGEALLSVIGIGMPAFRISGGLLLFLMAVDMLFERRSERREKRKEASQPDPSVFPLAMPLIAGPGALAAMILLTSRNSGDVGALLAIHLVLAVVVALTYALFRAGGLIERLLGNTGVIVVTRLLGILLAALAVQFVLDGLREIGLIGAAA
jgi:multiple antibiotic resistance protein